MKAIKYLILITMLPVCVATAGDKGEQQDWMREAIAKDRTRAQETVKNFSDAQRFEERYGWAKEKQPELLAALLNANKKAAESWSAVIRKADGATNPDSLAEVKQVANAASADAYLAEITLKYGTSAADRKSTVEKSRDRDVSSLAAKMDANERAILLTTRAKNEAQAAIEKLQNENRTLSNEYRAACDKARDKDRGKDNNREHEKEKPKEEHERPQNPEGGGGVLGR